MAIGAESQILDKPLFNPSGCRARLTSFWGPFGACFSSWGNGVIHWHIHSIDFIPVILWIIVGVSSINDGCPSHHGCCKTKSWPSSHPWRLDYAFGGTTQWLQIPHHQLWVKNQSEKLHLVGCIPTPLKNMSQLGWWNSMVPVTTNQYIYIHIPKPIYSWFTHY